MQLLSTSIASGSVENNYASFVFFFRSHCVAQHALTLRKRGAMLNHSRVNFLLSRSGTSGCQRKSV